MIICRYFHEEKHLTTDHLINRVLTESDYFLDFDTEGIIINLECVGLAPLFLAVDDRNVSVFADTGEKPFYYEITKAEAETLLDALNQ